MNAFLRIQTVNPLSFAHTRQFFFNYIFHPQLKLNWKPKPLFHFIVIQCVNTFCGICIQFALLPYSICELSIHSWALQLWSEMVQVLFISNCEIEKLKAEMSHLHEHRLEVAIMKREKDWSELFDCEMCHQAVNSKSFRMKLISIHYNCDSSVRVINYRKINWRSFSFPLVLWIE